MQLDILVQATRLQSKSWRTRRAAIRKLGGVINNLVLPYINEGLVDPEREVVLVAVKACQKLIDHKIYDDTMIERLIDATNKFVDDHQLEAATVLCLEQLMSLRGSDESGDIKDTLCRLALTAKTPDIRQFAVSCLDFFKSDSLDVISACLDDTSDDVRLEALRTIDEIFSGYGYLIADKIDDTVIYTMKMALHELLEDQYISDRLLNEARALNNMLGLDDLFEGEENF